jgi:hypothetical protein
MASKDYPGAGRFVPEGTLSLTALARNAVKHFRWPTIHPTHLPSCGRTTKRSAPHTPADPSVLKAAGPAVSAADKLRDSVVGRTGTS